MSPLEIDEVLHLHPDVDQAVTFPIADAKFGAVAASAVVLRPGASVAARGLKWFAATHLPCFKVPQRILIVDSIPRVPRTSLARALGFSTSARGASLSPVQMEGRGTPVFVIGSIDTSRLRSDRPIYCVREPAIAHLPPPHTIEHVAAECLHALRGFQPEGPYALAACAASRSVAIEMARQLEQAGEKVEFVAVFNSGEFESHRLPYDRQHSWPGRTVHTDFVGVE